MTSLSASSETGLSKPQRLDQLKSDAVMNTISNNLNEDLQKPSYIQSSTILTNIYPTLSNNGTTSNVTSTIELLKQRGNEKAGMNVPRLNSPTQGRELEFIIDLVKQLNNSELAIEQSREKLVLRCKEFNNKVALKLFNPPKEQ